MHHASPQVSDSVTSQPSVMKAVLVLLLQTWTSVALTFMAASIHMVCQRVVCFMLAT
jgi:hypothetical protein